MYDENDITDFLEQFVLEDPVSESLPFLDADTLARKRELASLGAVLLCVRGADTVEEGLQLWARLFSRSAMSSVVAAYLNASPRDDASLAPVLRFAASYGKPCEAALRTAVESVGHGDEEVRIAVAHVLLVADSAEHMAVKLSLLEDASAQVREVACMGLAVARGDERPRAVDAVNALMEDPSMEVRVEAVDVLSILTGTYEQVPLRNLSEYVVYAESNLEAAGGFLVELEHSQWEIVDREVGALLSRDAPTDGWLENWSATLGRCLRGRAGANFDDRV